MNLEQKINEDIKAAMLAKDKESLNALRAVKAALLLLKTEKNAAEITEEIELKTLQKLVKQRKEAAEVYKNQNREDLYQEEMAQVVIISKYLPAQMSETEITNVVKQFIETEHITDMKEMGKLMGLVSKALSGKADNKLIAEIVKKCLS
ncbi:MAG: GatB/YqeY domain-containing protein [Bacteroidales bacterium]|nr:GatB/YqeY domain-containing protein [Bacteroidales bacterium]